ncbi:DUF6088 family protein [Myroides sp. mNGS23_01]|nr:DUF6088 family protein [Myroides sp. mNGS23_01]WHT40246.1 DUF6088 family protein [Myroides sp. mNGS23_01]
MSYSIHNQIENKIIKSSKRTIFFADDFVKYGTSDNIRQVLFRLEKKQCIERLAAGIYVKPKRDTVLGTIYPSVEEIAKEVAKRDKIRIAPTGIMAQYLLGLTTQIPLKAVYLTDGSPREIKIGNRILLFKRTVPKTFEIKDQLLYLIVQAFKAKGQEEVTLLFLKQITPAILKVDRKMIESQLRYAPVWIQKEINRLYYSNAYVD